MNQRPTPPYDDPLKIARARHASQQRLAGAQTASTNAANSQKPSGLGKLLPQQDVGGCLFLSVVGFVFIAGSILGGIIGGGVTLLLNQPLAVATLEPTPTPAPVATSTATPVLLSEQRTIEDVIAETLPAVVTIINQQSEDVSDDPNEGRVVGSGVIIDARGYIATNNHVVENPGKLKVILSDGRKFEAHLIATKPDDDLAVLKLPLVNLPVVRWGDSTKLRPGQSVYALGSPLGDFPNSVSQGVVSGLNRALEMDKFVIDGLIQTDTAINRGSSGGPLININGEVVGLNTFIIRESEERGIAEGIAFAIPAEFAKQILLPWVAADTAETEAIPVGN